MRPRIRALVGLLAAVALLAGCGSTPSTPAASNSVTVTIQKCAGFGPPPVPAGYDIFYSILNPTHATHSYVIRLYATRDSYQDVTINNLSAGDQTQSYVKIPVPVNADGTSEPIQCSAEVRSVI